MTSPASSSQDTSSDPHTAEAAGNSGLAQAFRDVARGEQTAQALEANLTNLERRLDELLADMDKPELRKAQAPNGNKTHGASPDEYRKA